MTELTVWVALDREEAEIVGVTLVEEDAKQAAADDANHVLFWAERRDGRFVDENEVYEVRPFPLELASRLQESVEATQDPMAGTWCALCLIPSPAGSPEIHKPGCAALGDGITATQHSEVSNPMNSAYVIARYRASDDVPALFDTFGAGQTERAQQRAQELNENPGGWGRADDVYVAAEVRPVVTRPYEPEANHG